MGVGISLTRIINLTRSTMMRVKDSLESLLTKSNLGGSEALGRIVSVEIMHQADDTSKTNPLPHYSETKKMPCALCERNFLKSSLVGKVSRMNIAKLRGKWRESQRQNKMTDYASKKDTSQNSRRVEFSPRCYDYTGVCRFCLQFFEANVFDEEACASTTGLHRTGIPFTPVKLEWPARNIVE